MLGRQVLDLFDLISGGDGEISHEEFIRGGRSRTSSIIIGIVICVITSYGQSRTKILDFRGFYSSIILIVRGGILMSVGIFQKS